jgi:hypothetical protein
MNRNRHDGVGINLITSGTSFEAGPIWAIGIAVLGFILYPDSGSVGQYLSGTMHDFGG